MFEYRIDKYMCNKIASENGILVYGFLGCNGVVKKLGELINAVVHTRTNSFNANKYTTPF